MQIIISCPQTAYRFFFFIFFKYNLPPLDHSKNNIQNDSNFQAVAHIQIILQKPNTSLATEMRKMALTPVTISFLPTLPLPP